MRRAVRIGGEAGQGLQTIGSLLGRLLARRGFFVFAYQDNESRIRGGHNFFQVQIADGPILGPWEKVDLLVGLDSLTAERDGEHLVPGGIFLGDTADTLPRGSFGLPVGRIAREAGGSELFRNAVILGAILAVIGEPLTDLEPIFAEAFPGTEAANLRATRAGYEAAGELFGRLSVGGPPREPSPGPLFLSGHEALALGALAADCRFMAAYPMSPSTGIITFLAGVAEEFGLVVEQAEDEIAAINMAIGASFAGVRSMTATSGGGFSLMVEGLGLAGMTETPVVVVVAQRPGPATGLPTRTEQADLQFVIHAAQGEFPRVVLAPRTAAEAYAAAIRAFDLAERYQIPVIIMTDQHLGESYVTVDDLEIPDPPPPDTVEAAPGYRRYLLTPDGLSPRARPGTPGVLVYADSDEHDEDGHIIEDAPTRRRMVEKRMGRLELLRREIQPPLREGPEGAEWTLVGWGSSYGAIREAAEALVERGISCRTVHFAEVWPLPPEPLMGLTSASKIVVVEGNYTGQLARLLAAETGRSFPLGIRRYDGRPLSADFILDGFYRLGPGGGDR